MGKILFIFISLFLLSSCLYEDKGNYDYNRLPDLEIWGVEENYGDSFALHRVFEDCSRDKVFGRKG